MMTYTVNIEDNGTKFWYLNGKLHREDGPAVEYTNGTKYWYLNGERHRTDGPAEEWPDGSKCWFLNGKRHRKDGPAVEYADGTKRWYLNDKELTEAQFVDRMKKAKRTYEGRVVEIDGVRYRLSAV